jgi:hypothetical protein
MSRREELRDLLTVLDADPLSALEAVRQLQALVDEELLSQVGRARRRGVTWAGIADALGVTSAASYNSHTRKSGVQRGRTPYATTSDPHIRSRTRP